MGAPRLEPGAPLKEAHVPMQRHPGFQAADRMQEAIRGETNETTDPFWSASRFIAKIAFRDQAKPRILIPLL